MSDVTPKQEAFISYDIAADAYFAGQSELGSAVAGSRVVLGHLMQRVLRHANKTPFWISQGTYEALKQEAEAMPQIQA